MKKMKNNKYYFITYSCNVRGESHRNKWNEVTDMNISDWWLETLKILDTDEYHYDPVLDFFAEITKEDFDKLNGNVG